MGNAGDLVRRFRKIGDSFHKGLVVGEKVAAEFSTHNFRRTSGYYLAGQIIATSHDLTPNGGLVREIPLFQGNLGW